LGELSGTVRYQVLSRAAFRCELCGVPADEQALEVDHIIPRRHGGQDDETNLQALCWRCNANKGARDATDFRAVRAALDDRQAECPFCDIDTGRIIGENRLAVAVRDAYPVTPLHTLVFPRRHANRWFDLSVPEQRAISLVLDTVRKEILDADKHSWGLQHRDERRRGCGPDAPPRTCPPHPAPIRRSDFSGPTWKLDDGSAVVGEVVAKMDAPEPAFSASRPPSSR
jgi:ATP adenylyltransferase